LLMATWAFPKPRTTRGFLLWAVDLASLKTTPKPCSNRLLLKTC
jgi:hypothetical protein